MTGTRPLPRVKNGAAADDKVAHKFRHNGLYEWGVHCLETSEMEQLRIFAALEN